MKANNVSMLLSLREKELIKQTHDVGQGHSISPFNHQIWPDAKTDLHDSSSNTSRTDTVHFLLLLLQLSLITEF